jgi:hypothetical protein
MTKNEINRSLHVDRLAIHTVEAAPGGLGRIEPMRYRRSRYDYLRNILVIAMIPFVAAGFICIMALVIRLLGLES